MFLDWDQEIALGNRTIIHRLQSPKIYHFRFRIFTVFGVGVGEEAETETDTDTEYKVFYGILRVFL